MNYSILLKGLSEASKTPYAFVAYALIILSWTANILLTGRLRIISKNLKQLPEQQRIQALALEYNLRPKGGLSSAEYLRNEKRKYFLIAFVITVVAMLLLFTLSISKSIYALKNSVQQKTLDLAFTTFIRGTTSADSKRWESTITDMQNSVSMYPSYGGYINLAYAYDYVGDSKAALYASKKAMDLNPTNPSPYMKIGTYYSDLDEFDSAKYYLTRCLVVFDSAKLNDNEFLVSILGNLGDLYADKADAESDSLKKLEYATKALKDYFEKALELESSITGTKYLAMILGNAANAYRIVGNFNKAKALLAQSVELKEELLHKTDEYNSLGYGYLYSGDIYLATKDLSTSIKYYMKQKQFSIKQHFPSELGQH
jgi:tetratricopeptide (TPR) repeat protein